MGLKGLVVQFATPAHKNVSIYVQDVTEDDITKVIENIASNASWVDKEVKDTVKGKEFSFVPSYSTVGLLMQSLNLQLIQFYVNPYENGFQVDIESRFFISSNKIDLLVYMIFAFFVGIGIYGFFDFFSLNRKNLTYCIQTFQMVYTDKIKIIKPMYTRHITKKITGKDIVASLGICILKVYMVFILVILLGIGVYGCLWFLFEFYFLVIKDHYWY